MTRLSVVIPTRDRRDRVVEVARAVLGDPAVDELIVADDGSSDGTGEALRQAFGNDVRFRCLDAEGMGKAHAEQMALDTATGEVVLFLDDDVLPGPGLACGHLRHHDRRPGLLVAGYMPILHIPTGPGHAPAKIYQRDYERICRAWEEDPSTILHNLWGGNVSLRREDAVRIGLRSPDFPGRARHVDREFGLRCLEAGLVGVFDRSLAAEHLYERPLARMLDDARWQGTGMVHVHRRHVEIIGPFDPRDLAKTATWQRGAVVRLGSTRFGHRPVVALLTMASGIAGRFARYDAEIALTRLLRKSEQAYHAHREIDRLDRSR